MPVTLKDVARRANVSPVVVSKVLHGKLDGIRVSAATAERVREAARELDYHVNVWARNFRAQRAMMIGVLNGRGIDRPLFSTGPRYFATLLDGIVEGAFKHDYSVALCPQLLGGNPLDAVSDGRFAGLLWYSIAPSQTNLEALEACTVPSVIAHARASTFGNRHATVICDNAQGIGLAITHLIDRGHRRIAFATESDAQNVETEERLEGYRQYMRKHGLPVQDADILDFERNRNELHRYLEQGPRHTAIVAHADGLAADIIRLASEYGVRVPQDLAVIGFDSTEFCDELRPTLTSVSQPLYDIGKSAVELLISMVDSSPGQPIEILKPCGLDIRESTDFVRSEVVHG
jgi:DNA-binding LacI/PurR family transcriptional regulator